MEDVHIPNAVKSRGIDVREQINQGFVRSELGTAADDKATRIYDAAEINPVLLERHASSAVSNYVAAISCFLRAIPSVKDVRSKRLLQEHVNNLLLRLRGMRNLLAEAERLLAMNGGNPVHLEPWEKINYIPGDFDPRSMRDEFEDDLHDAFDLITAEMVEEEETFDRSNMFQVGTDIEVKDKSGSDVWRKATVSGYERDKYNVKYPDGSEEIGVDSSRVRLPKPQDTRPKEIISLEHELRMEIMSEIVESERKYNFELKNLNDYYVHSLRNPAHWGGQKDSSDTLFSQKTLNDEEAKAVFSNIEEIIAMNREFLCAMEHAFQNMQTDQSLATVFVRFAPKFKLYTDYVVYFEESQNLIAKMRKERMGFVTADEVAAQQHVPPLAELMKLPVERIPVYLDQLKRLQERTPAEHPSFPAMTLAVELFHNVQEYMKQALRMKENRAVVKKMEQEFSPVYPLSNNTRFFIFKGKLTRMEEGNVKKRFFWLFNDILVCGRESEWLNRGYYRHLGTLTIKGYGDSPDFGPLSFYVRGTAGKWIMVCRDADNKAEWLSKLALCPGAVNETRRQVAPGHVPTNSVVQQTARLASLSVASSSSAAPSPPPPPPPPRQLPPGWVELVDPSTQKTYYYCASLQKTQWEKPTI